MVASVADACRESVVVTMLATTMPSRASCSAKVVSLIARRMVGSMSPRINQCRAVRGARDECRRGGIHVRSTRRSRATRLHCLIVELIDDFFAEYPPAPGGSDKVDTEEGRNHRGGRGEDKSRSGRRCWRCYRIWPGGGLAVSFAMAKAKSGIGNAVRRAVKHGIETVSSSCG